MGFKLIMKTNFELILILLISKNLSLVCVAGQWSEDSCICKASKCPAGQGNATTDATTETGGCADCAAGTYSAKDAATCTDCAAGTWSAAEATTCTVSKCPAGQGNATTKATAEAGGCADCAAGTWAAANSATCSVSKCPAGQGNASTKQLLEA